MFIPEFVVEQMQGAEANSDISGVTFVQGFSFEELSQIWKSLHVELSKYKSKCMDDVKFRPLKQHKFFAKNFQKKRERKIKQKSAPFPVEFRRKTRSITQVPEKKSVV